LRDMQMMIVDTEVPFSVGTANVVQHSLIDGYSMIFGNAVLQELYPFYDCRRTHTGRNAKRGKASALAGPFQFIK
jgi:muramidase (phage lysozyme)